VKRREAMLHRTQELVHEKVMTRRTIPRGPSGSGSACADH